MSFWEENPGAEAVLRTLWKEGRSASTITYHLNSQEFTGHVTRNAVIGKAHRLHLSSRPSPIKRRIERVEPREAECMWPIGHPTDDDFTWCGEPAEQGKPYCAEHCSVAYRNRRKGDTKPIGHDQHGRWR